MKRFFQKLFIVLTMISFCVITTNAQTKNTASVVRYNSGTGTKECLCDIDYYVSGKTLYVSKQFSYLGIIFTDSDGRIKCEKSILMSSAQKNGMWTVNLDNPRFKNVPAGTTINGIVLRNCKQNNTTGVYQCYDAYLYNNVSSIPQWRGTNVINGNTRSIINIIQN